LQEVKPVANMQKRLVFLFLAILLLLALVPAYYATDDDALQQNTSYYDVFGHSLSSAGVVHDVNHSPSWTGLSLSWDIFYHLPQHVPSKRGTRAPPF
jgi:hypothetical protein